MDGTPIGSIRTGIITGAGRRASGKTDLGAFEFCPSLCGFRAVPTHPKAFFADGNAIVPDCEVVFINWWTAAFSVEVNERLDAMVTAVFVVGHVVMCRIEQKLVDMGFRKELQQGEIAVQESV